MKLTEVDTVGQLAYELVRANWRKLKEGDVIPSVGNPFFTYADSTCPHCCTRHRAVHLYPNTEHLADDAQLAAVNNDEGVITRWEVFEAHGGSVMEFDISDLDLTAETIGQKITNFLGWEEFAS